MLYLFPMPIVFRQDGFRYFFYSNEGNPREPAHVHVMAGEREAKFWLRPDVALAESQSVDARTLRRMAVVVEARRDDIERAWNDHFR
jgi:diadenosine tetraphosphate (Ap4A) HIT family hydrolase